MASKPSIPKGTRDFSPVEMARRNYIFDTISEVFTLYGFRSIETPAMENLSTLLGKYGDEGDKLLFKILNSGDWMSKTSQEYLDNKDSVKLTSQVSEKGLRYDLTVPFARYVVQHRNEIQFPFKRYQIQPVWRADRPQKGRYREFYQCDADVVGSNSLINEVELLQIVDEVFSRLGINVIIKLNNRKVLAGIAEYIGVPDKIIDITVAIDKLDKIGMEAVEAELAERGLSVEAIEKLRPVLGISGTVYERLEQLSQILAGSKTGTLGVEELKDVVNLTKMLGLRSELDLDVSLARGLNYYTGTIIEVKAKDVAIGSITGGGRYDNLTGIFGMTGVSGVGISFGADRIYDVLNTLDLYPESTTSATTVMFANLGDKESAKALSIASGLRKSGISAEVYPDTTKMKKQMAYADNCNIPYVAIIGSEELDNGTITLKNMKTGEQSVIPESGISEVLLAFK
ncbi:MAG: histidine--tRNA ligase [Muribaculaceae bacterium]|nr:histidine--tRNA ligase [Muribaculaceae bacterium]